MSSPVLTEEMRYKLLKLVDSNPAMSQRRVARELGISLGKVNFCLNALIQAGLIKVANFKNSDNKSGYIYLLTPRGIKEKAQVTARFLQWKIREYEALQAEIEQIRSDVLRQKSG
jgi:EPS-associated MarR family transcriptional regulator